MTHREQKVLLNYQCAPVGIINAVNRKISKKFIAQHKSYRNHLTDKAIKKQEKIPCFDFGRQNPGMCS